jgi:hypothetical protein
MRYNVIQLMRQSKVIAQSLTPMDTGNLRYNSIVTYPTPNGFRITSRYTVAFYGALLDTYGAGQKKTHKGWWSINVAKAVATFVEASLNDRRSTFQQASVMVSQFAADNPERRSTFYNAMIPDKGRQSFVGKHGLM